MPRYVYTRAFAPATPLTALHPRPQNGELDLHQREIDFKGMEALAKALEGQAVAQRAESGGASRTISVITSINLSLNRLELKGALAVKSMLSGSVGSQLVVLNLKNNSLRAEGAKAVADGLTLNAASSLRRLNMDSNSIGPEGFAAFASALRSPRCALEALSLSYNKGGVDGGEALASALRSPSCRLAEVDLEGNNMRAAGGAVVAAALEKGTLRTINLSCNGIRNRTMMRMLGFIKRAAEGDAKQIPAGAAGEPAARPVLRELKLRSNRIGAKTIMSTVGVVASVSKSWRLHLDLQYNVCTVEGHRLLLLNSLAQYFPVDVGFIVTDYFSQQELRSLV